VKFLREILLAKAAQGIGAMAALVKPDCRKA
jgi:hypothetical protein